MRALVYAAPCKVIVEEHPRPQTISGECEIAISAAGICGSDLAAFLGKSRRRKPPMILGHELAGRRANGRRVVVDPLISCGHCFECQRGAENLCPGLRLLGMDETQGCFAEFVSVPETQVHDIPDGLPDSRAVLAEPLANVVHLFRLALHAEGRIGIIGAGLMGSLALQLARSTGELETVVEDVCAPRVENARKMGATLAVDASAEHGRAEAARFAGRGLNLVIDACGTREARQEAFDLCRPGGQVLLLGMASARSELDFVASIYREQSVAMSFGYTPRDFARSLELLTAGLVDLAPWTAEFPFEEGQRAFEQMAGPRGATLKVLLRGALCA